MTFRRIPRRGQEQSKCHDFEDCTAIRHVQLLKRVLERSNYYKNGKRPPFKNSNECSTLTQLGTIDDIFGYWNIISDGAMIHRPEGFQPLRVFVDRSMDSGATLEIRYPIGR